MFFLGLNFILVAQCFLGISCGQTWITNFLHGVCKMVVKIDARCISQGLRGLEYSTDDTTLGMETGVFETFLAASCSYFIV